MKTTNYGNGNLGRIECDFCFIPCEILSVSPLTLKKICIFCLADGFNGLVGEMKKGNISLDTIESVLGVAIPQNIKEKLFKNDKNNIKDNLQNSKETVNVNNESNKVVSIEEYRKKKFMKEQGIY